MKDESVNSALPNYPHDLIDVIRDSNSRIAIVSSNAQFLMGIYNVSWAFTMRRWSLLSMDHGQKKDFQRAC